MPYKKNDLILVKIQERTGIWPAIVQKQIVNNKYKLEIFNLVCEQYYEEKDIIGYYSEKRYLLKNMKGKILQKAIKKANQLLLQRQLNIKKQQQLEQNSNINQSQQLQQNRSKNVKQCSETIETNSLLQILNSIEYEKLLNNINQEIELTYFDYNLQILISRKYHAKFILLNLLSFKLDGSIDHQVIQIITKILNHQAISSLDLIYSDIPMKIKNIVEKLPQKSNVSSIFEIFLKKYLISFQKNILAYLRDKTIFTQIKQIILDRQKLQFLN